jgi:hypothetical protein
MASSRQEDKSTHAARNNNVREISESTAEQTRRMGEAAADASQNAVRLGADLQSCFRVRCGSARISRQQ